MSYKNPEDKRIHNQRYYKKWYAKNGRNRAINYCEAIIKWQKKHLKEIAIQGKLRYAVKIGKIIRPTTCSKCERKTRISGHHENYSKPLKVVWVCSSCHKKIHLGWSLDKFLKV